MSRRCLSRKARPLFRSHDEPLAPKEAQWVLENYWWEVIVPAFAAKGYDEPGRIRSLVIDPSAHDNCRHFAGTAQDGSKVIVAPELASMPDATVIAILAHEAGHVVDLSNPGIFWFRAKESFYPRDGIKVAQMSAVTNKGNFRIFECLELPQKGFNKHIEDWKERGREEEEQLADALAEWVLGVKIGYVGSHSCLVETLGEGVPRPVGLR